MGMGCWAGPTKGMSPGDPGEPNQGAGGSGWIKTSHPIPTDGSWRPCLLRADLEEAGAAIGWHPAAYEFREHMLVPHGFRKWCGPHQEWPRREHALDSILPVEGEAGSHLPHPWRGTGAEPGWTWAMAPSSLCSGSGGEAHGGGCVSQACGPGDALGPCQAPPTRLVLLIQKPSPRVKRIPAQGRVWLFPASSGLSWLFPAPRSLLKRSGLQGASCLSFD